VYAYIFDILGSLEQGTRTATDAALQSESDCPVVCLNCEDEGRRKMSGN